MTKILLAAILALAIALPASAQDTWRAFAQQMPIGSTLKVRLTDGRRFSAVLVEVRPDAVLLQPRTRQPVPVQPLAYADIAALERIEPGRGMSAAKSVAIGAATGGGVFLALMIAMVSAID